MDKKRKIKLVISIVIWLLVVLSIAYVIAAYVRLNDKNIPLNTYSGATFSTRDLTYQIEFNGDCSYAYITSGGEDDKRYSVEYEENIITFTNAADLGDVRHFILLERELMFGDGQYLYWVW